MQKILIVDDEQDICLLLKKYLTKNGYEAHSALNGQKAVEFLKSNPVDLVICDFKLPDYTGIDILQKIKIIDSKIQVIIITGYSDIRIAVQALKKGAYEYVTKPLYPDEILATVKSALASEAVEVQKTSKKSVGKIQKKQFVVGQSRQAELVQKHIQLIAPTDMSVIIQGETGTGKEYVARAIHDLSSRSDSPFIAIDCGALPMELAASELFGHVKGAFTGAMIDKKGCFELANKGTLFLDEIGNLNYDNQVKLLRVLQERRIRRVGGDREIEVDVRVLVATNDNLKEAARTSDFREDVYHRLNEFQIELAPLRERKEDIEVFAQHFLDKANNQLDKNIKGFTASTFDVLMRHTWHGNLRELQNVVRRAVLLCQGDQVTKECLPVEMMEYATASDDSHIDIDFGGHMPGNLKVVVEHAERSAIREVLKRTGNNKTKTAELLGVDRKTLYNKLKAYDIEH